MTYLAPHVCTYCVRLRNMSHGGQGVQGESRQLLWSFSMLGPVGAWPPSTWTPVRGYAPSPSLPTLAIQVLSSFPPLLQLLQSYATMEEQKKKAIYSVHCASAHQAAQRVAEQASFCISGAQFHPSLCFSGFYVALFQQLYLLPLSPWYLLCPVPQSCLLFLQLLQ